MGAKVTSSIESHLTSLSSIWVHKVAREWLLLQVDGADVLLESGMLAKRLSAWRIFGAAVFILSIMSSKMATKTGASHKTFIASRTIANIITNTSVGALYMVVEMRGS